MKIVKVGEVQTVMSNLGSKHDYFAWPTAARLQNGKIAVGASGFRMRHICPFGKGVMAISEDEGETYTAPVPVIDTVLDDRDLGILPYGESSVMITSFNNSVEFQRVRLPEGDQYSADRLDQIKKEDEARDLGVTYRISHDCGKTYGPIHRGPVSSPHGPTALSDGSILWVGNHYGEESVQDGTLYVYRMTEENQWEQLSEIAPVETEKEGKLDFCEPYAMQLPDGKILCHIRAERPGFGTLYQCISEDGGKTWSEPQKLLEGNGGNPAHLLRHSSGVLISVYGTRIAPTGIKAMFSLDNGKTWDIDHDIYIKGQIWDLGYPSTVELNNGDLLTVFYMRPAAGQPAMVYQQRWRMEK